MRSAVTETAVPLVNVSKTGENCVPSVASSFSWSSRTSALILNLKRISWYPLRTDSLRPRKPCRSMLPSSDDSTASIAMPRAEAWYTIDVVTQDARACSRCSTGFAPTSLPSRMSCSSATRVKLEKCFSSFPPALKSRVSVLFSAPSTHWLATRNVNFPSLGVTPTAWIVSCIRETSTPFKNLLATGIAYLLSADHVQPLSDFSRLLCRGFQSRSKKALPQDG